MNMILEAGELILSSFPGQESSSFRNNKILEWNTLSCHAGGPSIE